MEDVERAKDRINEALGYNKSYETKPDEFQEIDWGNVEAEYEAAQKKKWAKFPPLKKDFYEEHPNVAAMSRVIVLIFVLRYVVCTIYNICMCELNSLFWHTQAQPGTPPDLLFSSIFSNFCY